MDPSNLRTAALRQGLRGSVPLVPGVVAFGLVWGTLAGQAGLSAAEAVLMSGLVFAGASQFVVLPLWQAAAELPLGAIVAATVAVNLRFALMSAAMLPLFEREGTRWRWAKAFLISDENWALTSAEMARRGGSVGFLLGGGLAIYASWVLSCLLGRLAGTLLGEPSRWGLDFAFTASVVALLVGLWRGRASLLPWSASAAGAVIAQALWPGHWSIVIGGLCGCIAGAWAGDSETTP